MYKALDIAKYTIDKCTKEEISISNLQLQKILYYMQEKYLKEYQKPLFDEEIQAWQFGPVVPEVYANYCGYGAMPIENEYNINVEKAVKEVIDPIIEDKAKLEPWDLVEETHRKNGPWDRVYDSGRGNRHTISKELIGKL